MSGRKKDCVWLYFDKFTVHGKSGCKAKCKKCAKQMQGLVSRMKQHVQDCNSNTTSMCDLITADSRDTEQQAHDAIPDSPATPHTTYTPTTHTHDEENLSIYI